MLLVFAGGLAVLVSLTRAAGLAVHGGLVSGRAVAHGGLAVGGAAAHGALLPGTAGLAGAGLAALGGGLGPCRHGNGEQQSGRCY